MSTNEASGPGNAPGPLRNLLSDACNDQADAQPGAFSSDFTRPDAPTGVQQDWYSHAVGQALMYAQNAAAGASHEQGPVPGFEAQQGDTFTWLLQRLGP